ncbi:MAG: efflux RND transporter periplasmic adaptor subunit [Gammaproteobacteria bacterium TMED92]|nr:MAG: efflux RND transporter periplasmic adaptor subunit [Gammaproteobacteria bacterium TMED92]
MMRTLLIPLSILAIFIFGAATLMATAPSLTPESVTPTPLTVRVIDAQPSRVNLTVTSQGTVTPLIESQLIPEVSGKIEWMSDSLVVGGFFNQGDELIRVESLDYETALSRAEAALLRAEAELEHSKFELARMRSLEERNLASRSNLENALRIYRVNTAVQLDAQANVKQAQENLNRTTLHAPFTGLVRAKAVDIGQFVSRGQAVATIYANEILEVRLPIADRQMAFLNIPPTLRGELPIEFQPVVSLAATYAGQQLQWNATIVRSEAEIDQASRMVQLVARIDNASAQVPISVGQFVKAQISGRNAEDVVVLPRSAVRKNNNVLVVDADNRLRFRPIETLRLYQDTVLVSGGLAAGERVCISPVQTAIEGMLVEPTTVPYNTIEITGAD